MSNKSGKKFSKKSAYLIGLSTVIVLTLFNQFLIQRILSEQKFDATVINLAGRQRMLSQKIAKEAYQTIEKEAQLDSLKKTTRLWDQVHEGLQEGDPELGLPELQNEEIQSLFDQLDISQEIISEAILSARSNEELAGSLELILENERQFLPMMDTIVNTFERDSQDRVRRLIYLEMFLAFFSMLVLIWEFLFIFKPIYDELDEENEELENTIKEVTLSKGELFKSTQRFDLSIEAINAGIWDWYIPDGTEWWSEKFYSLLGYKKGEIQASYRTFLYDLLHPDDREKVEKAVKFHLEKKKRYKLEIRMKTKKGNYRWFETVGQASWGYDGEPIRMVGSIIDIEEKKQLEAQLSSDEQMLRIQKTELEKALTELSEIQKVAKIGTWEVDLQTMTAHWSDEVYKIHEVPSGVEIKVEDGINYYREDYRPVIQNAIDNAIENKESWNVECILVTALGNEVWVRAIGFPVFENGELTALRGLFMDVDKERRAIEDKQQAELVFRSIFDNTFNFTGLLEPDGTLIEANKSALDFGGFTMEDARGLNFADAPWWSLSEEINQQLRDAIKRAASGEFIRYDVDVVGVGGKVITIDFSIIPIFDEEGNVVYLVPEGRDITERKELENEIISKTELLKLSEKQLQTFINQAPVAVGMLDKDMNYIAASNKWYEEYGIKDDNIIGKCHYDLFPEIRKMPDWLDIHKDVLSGSENSNPRSKFIREDGSIQWISWKLLPWYDEPGEVGGMIMYTADITNEVKYQEQLENLNEVLEHQVEKRTEELNKANQELEAFSYSVSHDLRAPLRSINGFADILEEDYRDSLDEEGLRLLGIIKSSGIKMGQLIDDILEFSRLGRKELKKGKVIMQDVFKEITSEVSLHHKDLNINFKIDQLPDVKGDLSLLKQVVTNLVSNAVKYSSKEKEIMIEVSSIEKEDRVVFSIKDNGTGFDMKYHDKLFGVFQRLHSLNEFEGTGVGLAIVRRIVTKHGGEIWAESELDKGSTFYFSLPSN